MPAGPSSSHVVNSSQTASRQASWMVWPDRIVTMLVGTTPLTKAARVACAIATGSTKPPGGAGASASSWLNTPATWANPTRADGNSGRTSTSCFEPSIEIA